MAVIPMGEINLPPELKGVENSSLCDPCPHLSPLLLGINTIIDGAQNKGLYISHAHVTNECQTCDSCQKLTHFSCIEKDYFTYIIVPSHSCQSSYL
jgi:hypothetical protein